MTRRNLRLAVAMSFATIVWSHTSWAEKAYGPGVSDTEIKLGQTMPLSGPASAYATVGKAMAAYFAKVNAEGGVNGRKITLITLDDGFAPPKTVEQTRRLVEQEDVLATMGSLGTATNAAIEKYMNEHKVPQLFIQSGAGRWNDPEHYPWSVPGLPGYIAESRAYARYILANKPDGKIAVLYQNDDFGKDYLKGLRAGLGDKADAMIIATQSYEVTDPTVDQQIISLAGSGADVLLTASLGKSTSQAIRKTAEIGWHPLILLSYVSSSVTTVLQPAGLEASTGIVSSNVYKDPGDPQWADDPAFKDWLAWMKQYLPDGNVHEQLNVSGYSTAMAMVEVLRRCGDDLTRENVLKEMTHLDALSEPMLQPGIAMTITPTDYELFKRFRMMRFDGTRWVPMGEPIGG
jgi:branched-chain amino acid transport system substrate-binding protein